MAISQLELLYGQDVLIEGVTLHQPKIKEILSVQDRDRYNKAVKLVNIGVVEILQVLGWTTEDYLSLSEDERKEISYFKLIKRIPELQKEMLDAFSFFIPGNIRFDEERCGFSVYNSEESEEPIGLIDEANIDVIRNAVLQICCYKSSAPPAKFKNEKARQIYFKCQERKAKLEAAKKKDDISLENVVSSVAAKSYTYSLFNIFDLTLYQLYDQFAQINKLNQLDVIALRWAAYGEEDFDWTLWYSND